MRALRNLIAEARTRDMLRPLAFDAFALALAFAALAGLWIITSPPAASAVPAHASATEANALATGAGR